jgi:hypothetical protein
MMSDYVGERIALLTQHGKVKVIGAALEPVLACVVERVSGFDTDLLGTFTRDTPRPGSQLEAVRRKARIGIDLSELSNAGYFIYCNGQRDRPSFNGRLEFDIHVIPYAGNDGWMENCIRSDHRCLTGNAIPDPTPVVIIVAIALRHDRWNDRSN